MLLLHIRDSFSDKKGLLGPFLYFEVKADLCCMATQVA